MNEYDSNRISDIVKKIGYNTTQNEILMQIAMY